MNQNVNQQEIRLLTIITKLELGGAQQVALNTLAKLNSKQYTKYLISSHGGLLDEQARAIPELHTFFWKSFKHPIRPVCDMVTLIRLIFFMKKYKINLVHTHSSKAGILGRFAAHFAKVPVVFHTVHGWSFHRYQNKVLSWIYIQLEKWTASMTTCLIAVSEATQKKGLAHNIGRVEQYRIIYPGSDLTNFVPANAGKKKNVRRLFNFSEEALLVGMVACLKPQKAPLDFVHAAYTVLQEIPQTRFLLIGDGTERQRVEQEVKRLGMEMFFVLAGWRNDVEKLMPAFDILALTSLWEGLPCVLGQAMSSGIPIVATDVEGSREAVIHEKNGLLVLPEQPELTAQALIRLLKDKTIRENMGAQGRQTAEKFSLSFMIKQLDELYQEKITH